MMGIEDKKRDKDIRFAVCPGAQKSATGTLRVILSQHPKIIRANVPETDYFCQNNCTETGVEGLLENYYPDIEKGMTALDVSPTYMYSKSAGKNIKEVLGDRVKLIFMLRNPAKRAFSQYNMNIALGIASKKQRFEEIIDQYERQGYRVYDDLDQLREKGCIERGFYAKQIEEYLKYFKKADMHFVVFEEFITDIEKAVLEIFEFLGLEKPEKGVIDYDACIHQHSSVRYPGWNKYFLRNKKMKAVARLVPKPLWGWFTRALHRINKKGAEKKQISKGEYMRLIEIYTEDIKQLENMTEKDLSIWKK